jgi:hypothetical protein
MRLFVPVTKLRTITSLVIVHWLVETEVKMG